MDLSYLRALMRVTTAVMELGQRAQAGDEDAIGRLGKLAELLEQS